MRKISVLVFVLLIIFSSFAYADYQSWDTYPDTTVDSESYPYQAIILNGTTTKWLLVSATPFWESGGTLNSDSFDMYYINDTHPDWTLNVTATTATTYSEILQANNDIYDSNLLDTVFMSKTTTDPLVYYQSDSNAFNLKAEDLVQNYGYRVYRVEHVVDGSLKADTKIAVPSTFDSVLSMYSVSGSFVEVAHTGESEVFYYDTPDMRDDQYGSMDLSADYAIYSFPDSSVPSLHSEEEITNLYKMYVVDASSTIQLIDSQERDLGGSWNLIYNPSTYSGVERWGLLVDLTDEDLLTVQDFKDNVHIGNDVAWTYVSDTLTITDGRVQGIMWFDYTIWLNTQYDLDIKYKTLLYDTITINSISTTGETTSSTDTTGVIVESDFDLSDWILHPIETITSIFRNLASQAMDMIDAMIPTKIIAPEIKALIMLSACVSLLLVILGRK